MSRVFLLQEPEDRCDLDVSKCSDPKVAELLCGSYRCFPTSGDFCDWIAIARFIMENQLTLSCQSFIMDHFLNGYYRDALEELRFFASFKMSLLKTPGFLSCFIVKRITIEMALPRNCLCLLAPINPPDRWGIYQTNLTSIWKSYFIWLWHTLMQFSQRFSRPFSNLSCFERRTDLHHGKPVYVKRESSEAALARFMRAEVVVSLYPLESMFSRCCHMFPPNRWPPQIRNFRTYFSSLAICLWRSLKCQVGMRSCLCSNGWCGKIDTWWSNEYQRIKATEE